MLSQERAVPAVSRGVGVGGVVVGWRGVGGRDEAWVRAIRQARKRTVRGEGFGKGVELPARTVVRVLGDVKRLEEGVVRFSSSLLKVGWRKMILGREGFLLSSLQSCFWFESASSISAHAPSVRGRPSMVTCCIPSPPSPPSASLVHTLLTLLPCFSFSYQNHCPTKQRSTKT